jgi:hypothetical protein
MQVIAYTEKDPIFFSGQMRNMEREGTSMYLTWNYYA